MLTPTANHVRLDTIFFVKVEVHQIHTRIGFRGGFGLQVRKKQENQPQDSPENTYETADHSKHTLRSLQEGAFLVRRRLTPLPPW